MNESKTIPKNAKSIIFIILFGIISIVTISSPLYAIDRYEINEFKRLIEGRSKLEIKNILGTPKSYFWWNNDPTGLWTFRSWRVGDWNYGWIVYDRTTGYVCGRIRISFENGRARLLDNSIVFEK